MEIEITEKDLQDMDAIISHFASEMVPYTTNIGAICVCMEALMKARDDLAEQLKENN